MSLIVVIIILALLFDYINGFHDAANSIATVVSTKVLTPLQAVIWAAFFNFVAYWIFQDHAVANTISKTVNKEFITLSVILSGLIAAVFWNLLTWWYGIPFIVFTHTYRRIFWSSHCTCFPHERNGNILVEDCRKRHHHQNRPFHFPRTAYRNAYFHVYHTGHHFKKYLDSHGYHFGGHFVNGSPFR